MKNNQKQVVYDTSVKVVKKERLAPKAPATNPKDVTKDWRGAYMADIRRGRKGGK